MALENDIKAHLDAQAFSTSAAWTVFCGPRRVADPPAIPTRAGFVLQTGGTMASPYMDGDRTAYRYLRAQVRIRCEPNEYAAGRDLAANVWSTFQQPSGMTGSYTRVTCEQSAPLYMGRDDFQCHEWTVNVLAEKRF